uniref:TNFRSF10C n=1 Tax=Lepidosiren paradoxus TaxID=7883 RepID=A0A6G6CWM8_LEPPA|nr:TNFRSF10C [Lepidosiren paradoxa]
MRVVMGLVIIFQALLLANSLPTNISRPFSKRQNIAERLLRQIICDADHYFSNRICCLSCPAGTYVKTPCKEANSTGTCLRCTDGKDYTEHPSGMDKCLTCSVCNPDQEVFTQCTVTKNTVCQCKAGTFCLPDQACEMCQRCKTSCPEGKVMVKPCQPTSDIECQPANGTLSSDTIIGIIIGVPLLVLLILVISVWCCWRKCNKNESIGENDPDQLSKQTQRLKMCLKKNYLKNMKTPSSVDGKQSEELLRSTQPMEAQYVNNMQICTTVSNCTDHLEQKQTLVPLESDPSEALRQSFYYFVKIVPATSWKPFVRHLKLTENEIATAEENNVGNREEQCFSMLTCWMQKTGKEASINKLLEMLSTMELSGVAEQITEEVTKKRYYTYTSEGQ